LPLSKYVKDYKFQLDYAFLPLGDLGYNHVVTLKIIFEKAVQKEEKVESTIKEFDKEIERELSDP